MKRMHKIDLLFQFVDKTNHRMSLRFSNPKNIVCAERMEAVIPALRQVQQAVKNGYYAAGYVSYEAAPAFDASLPARTKGRMPLLWFGLFDQPRPEVARERRGSFCIQDWEPTTSFEDYKRGIHEIKKVIQDGEISQTNYTIRLQASYEGDDLVFYEQLARMQSSHYSAYLNTGRFRVLSASPELFFRWDGQRIVMRPMKGTMNRGRWLEEDQAYMSALASSEKNRAENRMIVDLLQNDLARIAKTGSIQVPRLFEVERYPTVWQLTSTVTAVTRPRIELTDIFKALFPCGSVTGTPKANAMNAIAELEASPREVYCGAIGYAIPGGEAVFNVPIRTVIMDSEEGIATYGVGGGITRASTAEEEYDEVRVKSLLLTANDHPVFELLESVRLEHGQYTLWDRHLNRLKQSAEYFGFDVSIDRVAEEMARYAREKANAVEKVRVIVSKDGDVTIEGAPLRRLPPTLPVALASTPVSKSNRFLYHKTTCRSVYDRQRAVHPDVFDVLLWNEAGELTEFTTGNVVLELNGEKWTPPRDCGLLAGTFRDELVASGDLRVRVLTKEDLASCTSLWLINSVRGWVRVKLLNNG